MWNIAVHQSRAGRERISSEYGSMKRRLNTLSLQLQSVLFKALLDSNNWLFVHVCVCIFYVHKFVWGIVCFAMQQQCKAVPGQQMLGKDLFM